MAYHDGFVAAVPTANKDAYLRHARQAMALFREFGALRQVEGWGDDIPAGEHTDFARAVQAREDETVAFSWIEWPDKATRDAGMKAMMDDPRAEAMGDMPFDGKRMTFGGFVPLVDMGDGAGSYHDGYLVPVPHDRRDAYRDMAQEAAAIFLDHGALRVVESWGDDVPRGEHTDLWRGVDAREGENVVFSWVEWPSRAARAEGWQRIGADERMKHGERETPFDGKRMVYGGFETVMDERLVASEFI